MLCYRDRMFCDATDCADMECPRNTRGPTFCPDDFWKDHICIGEIKDTCADYQKEESGTDA